MIRNLIYLPGSKTMSQIWRWQFHFGKEEGLLKLSILSYPWEGAIDMKYCDFNFLSLAFMRLLDIISPFTVHSPTLPHFLELKWYGLMSIFFLTPRPPVRNILSKITRAFSNFSNLKYVRCVCVIYIKLQPDCDSLTLFPNIFSLLDRT